MTNYSPLFGISPAKKDRSAPVAHVPTKICKEPVSIPQAQRAAVN